MPRGRKRRNRGKSFAENALTVVRQAREAAKSALESLRREIHATTTKLATLVAEEKSFRLDLFGGSPRRGRPPGRPRKARGQAAATGSKPRVRRRGTPRAERFFQKLGVTFTLEDVRKLAGRKAGISLAQWSRAKRIRKVGKGYQKVTAA